MSSSSHVWMISLNLLTPDGSISVSYTHLDVYKRQGLGYAIAITDLVLAPFIPSNAARSGGTIYPIVSSICPMFDSYPDKNPRKIGSYLNWVALATTCVSSSIFLTGAAPNPVSYTHLN